MGFLTQGDAEKEDVVLSLWHDNLKLLVVTDGEKGCRYFSKVNTLNYNQIIYISLCLHLHLHPHPWHRSIKNEWN